MVMQILQPQDNTSRIKTEDIKTSITDVNPILGNDHVKVTAAIVNSVTHTERGSENTSA